ncbi:hypothetical protein MHYP_G00241450 [Metynnis hypsauchen]
MRQQAFALCKGRKANCAKNVRSSRALKCRLTRRLQLPQHTPPLQEPEYQQRGELHWQRCAEALRTVGRGVRTENEGTRPCLTGICAPIASIPTTGCQYRYVPCDPVIACSVRPRRRGAG